MDANKVCPNAYRAWWLLKLTYGLLYIVAGADKFIDLITVWSQYISPYVLQFAPAGYIISAVAFFEILLGIIILFGSTRIGGYLSAIWLVIIAIDLISMGLYDIAVRDLVMAVGAIAMSWLSRSYEHK